MTCTLPLATFAADNLAHFTIRYPGVPFNMTDGMFGGPLRPGMNEIVTDYWFPRMFIKTGKYTFKIEAVLPGKGEEEEDKYLFAFTVSQWLEGLM